MAPRSVASGVALSLGLISAAVSLSSALDKAGASGNVLVCDTGHPAQQIRQPRMCPDCGEIPYQQLKKARPVDGGLVVLSAEDIATANVDAERFKKAASITAHPAPQVEVQTTVGEKMYYLTPEKGHEAHYATLLALVEAHPDLAFMTQWTPRSSASQFQLRAYKGALVFQERTRAGELRDAPEIPQGDHSALIEMAEMYLAMPGMVSDYDPATYADRFEERLAEILATKEVVPTGDTAVTAPAVAVTDLMERLRAQVEAGKKPAKKPATTRRPRATKAREKVSA